MNYGIVYSSYTGNTKLLATSLKNHLPKEDCSYFGPPKLELSLPQTLFVGFWTDKGCCDQQTQNFLSTLSDKDIALFGTAGFGGSAEYYQGIIDRVVSLIPNGNRIAATFMCQGRMPDTVKERYQSMAQSDPSDPQIQKLLTNFDLASSHPNEEDLLHLLQAVEPVKKLLLI